MKIAIIGYSGAGKSTMAKALSELYQCPLLYLDTVHFEADWKERDNTEALKIVNQFLEKDSWVIDGNYRRFYQKERLEQADQILFFNYRRITCLHQAYKRYRTFKGQSRESISIGCDEKFDLEFIKWILVEGRSKKYKDNYQHIQRQYVDKIVVLNNKKQTAEYLQRVRNNG